MDILNQVKQAIELTKSKDFKSAERIYLEILNKDNENTTILSLLGILYLNTGNFKKAKTLLLKSDNLTPNNPTTTEALGLTLYNLNDFTNTIKYFEKIISTSKNYEVHKNYITSLIALDKLNKAYTQAKISNNIFPLKKEILSSLTYASVFSGQFKDAIKTSKQLLSAFPKYSESWLKQGLVQEIIYHNNFEALNCYKTALKYGNKTQAYYDLAIIYNKLNDYKKSEYYIKKVIKSNGESASLYHLLATNYLKQKDLKKGFKYLTLEDKYNDGLVTYTLNNLWDKKPHKNKSLAVFCMFGYGDVIMFSRYFPLLENYFKEIKIITPPSLIEFFKHNFKEYKKLNFIEHENKFPKTDFHVVMTNLPHLLRLKDNEFFIGSNGYLTPDENIVENYKTKYFQTGKLKVGICWEAGTVIARSLLNRSIPFTDMKELLKLDKLQFYSFQKDTVLNDYETSENIIDLGNTFKTFNETAGALKNLDILVTVDTSVAHLAGAMGVKTFLLLPKDAEWRWFNNDTTTEWYNSIKIFKQTDNLLWEKEIIDIKSELKNM